MGEELQPNMVRPQLYLASVRTEVYKDILDQNGITHILQAGVELRPTHPKHYTYLQLPLYDMPEQDIVAAFPAAFRFIESAMEGGGGVLVHCQAGVSRSAAIVIAYCMWKEHLSADAATSLVTAARSVVWPNAGFKCQLQEFEELHWDASRWGGWSMDKYLSKQYGDESVGFMAAMLGGAPQDRVKRQMQQQHGGGQRDAGYAAWGCPRESCTTYAATTSVGDCSRSSAASVKPEADSCRSSPSGCADQQLAGRHHGKSTCKMPGSAVIAKCHDTVSCSSGGMCRQQERSPGGMRRMSYACYCSSNAGASCTYGGAGSSHHRMRRHSTGQYALAAAAGVTAVQLGALKQLSLNAGSRLPEEAALLMAG